jgi:putative addiction module killer protein
MRSCGLLARSVPRLHQVESAVIQMIEIQESATFGRWMRRLRDSRARARIVARIQRMAQGNLGDAKPIGGGLSELRIHYGPGYRVYFMHRGDALIILLCGGDKSDQARDIDSARRIAADWLKANP